MSKKTLSLKAKFIITCASLVTALGLTSFFLLGRALEYGKEELKDSYLMLASSLDKAIEAQFFERYGDVQAFAENQVFQFQDKSNIVQALNNYARLYGIYDLILFVDTKGKLIAVNDRSAKGDSIESMKLYERDFSGVDWFKRAMAGQFTEDEKKGFKGTYFEEAVVDSDVEAVYGQKKLVSGFTAVVRDSKGQVIGVLSNRANFEWVEYEFKRLYEDLAERGLKNTELTLLNKNGYVLIDYDPASNNYNNEVIHNFESIILKFNLAEKGVQAAVELKAGRSGSMESLHARKKIDQIAGYRLMNSAKFPESIGWGVLVRTASKEALSSLNSIQLFLSIILVVGVLFSILVAYVFSGRVGGHIVSAYGNIEVSQNNIGMNSKVLRDSSQNVAGNSAKAAASLEETVASLDELTSMVKSNSENSSSASSLTKQGLEHAEVGSQKITALTENMGHISKSSAKISEIIDVIDEIAFQTNLLALNASVEAARAGQHGQGFAVVADAVRVLAQRSATAAKDISHIIRESQSLVQQGESLAKSTSDAFQGVLNSSQKISVVVEEIASANKEQLIGLQQIGAAMNQLDQATQENAASAEKLSGMSDALDDESSHLEKHVQTLRLVVQGA